MRSRSAVIATLTAVALLLGGCTSGSDDASVSASAAAEAAAAQASVAAQDQAAADAAARAAAAKQAAEQARLVKAKAAAEKAAADKAAAEKAEKAAAEKAAKVKAAKVEAAKVKAAKLKAAKVKAAKLKAAKLKAAKVKAAKLKAVKAQAAKARAAREKAAAARAAALQFDPLTGGSRSTNPVVAVKIDNTSAGRPQFGLASADVVYVEQVEGGLTRLIALFHSALPTEVGPVRSVRSTDVELLSSYGRPLIAFSGGAGGPLAMLAGSQVKDASGAAGYFRSSAKPAPYNLHANLQQVVASSPGAEPARSPGFVFATEYPALATAPQRSEITVRMNAGTTGFRWDGATKNYRVIAGGNPASDAAGRPVVTDNVLVQRVTDTPDGTVDTNGQPSLLSSTRGKGDFTLYRDGRELTGRWFRFEDGSPTKFLNARGQPVRFDRGRTWVTLAPQDAQITVR